LQMLKSLLLKDLFKAQEDCSIDIKEKVKSVDLTLLFTGAA